jgi:Tol biopolymer transport system component
MSKRDGYYGLYTKKIGRTEKLFDSGEYLEQNPHLAKYHITYDVSRDGKLLAYSALDEMGNMDIFILDLESKQSRNLTNDTGVDTRPVFSNDGKWIAYLSHERDGRRYDNIYLINMDGSVKNRLTGYFTRIMNLSFSPDDRSILFVKYFTTRSSAVSIFDLETGEVRDLTPLICASRSPQFCDRGDKIVYASDCKGNFDIWIMQSDGTDRRVLYESPGTESEPHFLPDGDRAVFISEYAGGKKTRFPSIYSVNIEDGAVLNLLPGKITNREFFISDLGVLKSGDDIYFGGRELNKFGRTIFSVYILDVKKKVIRKLVRDRLNNTKPIIRLDGGYNEKDSHRKDRWGRV